MAFDFTLDSDYVSVLLALASWDSDFGMSKLIMILLRTRENGMSCAPLISSRLNVLELN